jgi:16S rRNA (adenine1518-N6/adenine1519-N6)-dimethyltransferase
MKHIPRKRFGQNFLTDQLVLSQIIRSINPQAGDTMVEIGPGLAAMTRLLLEGVPQMHVVELDRDLVARLKKSFSPEKLIVHEGDALKFDFSSIPVPEGKKLRVVGNLPYNISSPLLFRLAEIAPLVQDQHFMLQKKSLSAWSQRRAAKRMDVCRSCCNGVITWICYSSCRQRLLIRRRKWIRRLCA